MPIKKIPEYKEKYNRYMKKFCKPTSVKVIKDYNKTKLNIIMISEIFKKESTVDYIYTSFRKSAWEYAILFTYTLNTVINKY